MTTLLFIPDIQSNYLMEFRAHVAGRIDDGVVLDRTAFYPEGGGQPSDTGLLRYGKEEVGVVRVAKSKEVVHHLDAGLPEGVTEVTGILDWERRYSHMRMHTAQHILSHVVFEMFGSKTAGNQIHADRSRIDFHPLTLTTGEMAQIEDAVNGIVEEGREVHIRFEDRHVLQQRIDPRRVDLTLIPSSVRRLRVVNINGLDEMPCAGTHVRSTAEVGHIQIMDRKSKGREKVRITYSLSSTSNSVSPS